MALSKLPRAITHQVAMFPHDAAVLLPNHHVGYLDCPTPLEALDKFPERIDLEVAIEDLTDGFLDQIINDLLFTSLFNALEFDLSRDRGKKIGQVADAGNDVLLIQRDGAS